MKYLSLVALLVLTACGGSGGGKSLPPTFNGDGANAVGCTTEVVAGVLPGINIDCGGGPVFVPYGIDGAKGDQGEAGVAGTDGVNGTNGADGNDGQDGADGVSCVMTAEPENNRVAIDCAGNIIYVPTSSSPTSNTGSQEKILLNNVSTIYSGQADYVTVKYDAEGRMLSEIFRKRGEDSTKKAVVYQTQYYDENEEFHKEDGPARVINGKAWTNYEWLIINNTKEWFSHGLLHRDNDKAAFEKYNLNYGEGGNYLTQKKWYQNGVNSRDNDNPSTESYGSGEQITRQLWTNEQGLLHRESGASLINFRDDGSISYQYFYCNNTYYKTQNIDTSGNITETLHNSGKTGWTAAGCSATAWDNH